MAQATTREIRQQDPLATLRTRLRDESDLGIDTRATRHEIRELLRSANYSDENEGAEHP